MKEPRGRSGRVPPGFYLVFVFNCKTKGRVLEAACLSLCPTSPRDEERDAKGTRQSRFYPSLGSAFPVPMRPPGPTEQQLPLSWGWKRSSCGVMPQAGVSIAPALLSFSPFFFFSLLIPGNKARGQLRPAAHPAAGTAGALLTGISALQVIPEKSLCQSQPSGCPGVSGQVRVLAGAGMFWESRRGAHPAAPGAAWQRDGYFWAVKGKLSNC